ncbi:MAG TPA: PAS domain S-box protein [Chthoniobacterales bacterium]|nr:PAS domain S-box protein [Chthoniobacterales bacterium]
MKPRPSAGTPAPDPGRGEVRPLGPLAAAVLLVEDDSAQAVPLLHLLRARLPTGSSAVHATSLAEALERVTTNQFDIVLLDLGLPDSDGMATLESVRSANSEIAIIILTGREDDELVRMAVRIGADDYFVKGEIAIAALIRAVGYAIERRRLARELFSALESRRRILDSSLDVICTLDAAGRFYEVSAACETVWGYTRQELIGVNSAELVHPADEAKTTGFVKEIVAGGMTRDFRNQWVRKDGTIVDLMWSAKWSSADKLMYCVARDVTERKRAVEALRESEKRFRELADFMPNVVWTSDASGRVDYYNRRWHELTGVSQEAADAHSWKTALHPDDVTRAVAAWTRAIDTGRPYQIEYRFLDCESGVYRWHLGRALPIRNNKGEIVRWYASGTDIHELKAAQEELVRAQQTLEERVQERTRQLADANRELEAFSYSVSHDLRTPLKAITGFSNILTESHAADLSSEAARYLENIDKGARQMEQLVDGLLAFSKLGWDALRPQQVNMRRLVDAALSMLNGARDGREVEITIQDLPSCRADETLLQQVWVNLLSNALKYTRERNPAVITIGSMREKNTDVFFVQDNGVGFDSNYADNLFGVFQRLHRAEDYEGTGVGLALVQRIIHRHGGHIWADAAEGVGATFFFTLAEPPA